MMMTTIHEMYELEERIGVGTYGEVFWAKDRRTGEVVAVKRFKRRGGASIERELEFLPKCIHPSIIRFKGLFPEDEGGDAPPFLYMVMEHAEEDLESVLVGSHPFTEGEACLILSDVLEGVAYLHGSGILHRDIKSSNLLMTSDGHVKICDFGWANRCDSGCSVPYTGQPFGTRLYMSPEVITERPHYSAAVDVWAVGCVMAELLLGHPPFPGKTAMDQLCLMFQLLSPTTRRLRTMFPPDLLSEQGFDLLSRMLTFDPEKRITSEQATSHPWLASLQHH